MTSEMVEMIWLVPIILTGLTQGPRRGGRQPLLSRLGTQLGHCSSSRCLDHSFGLFALISLLLMSPLASTGSRHPVANYQDRLPITAPPLFLAR